MQSQKCQLVCLDLRVGGGTGIASKVLAGTWLTKHLTLCESMEPLRFQRTHSNTRAQVAHQVLLGPGGPAMGNRKQSTVVTSTAFTAHRRRRPP